MSDVALDLPCPCGKDRTLRDCHWQDFSDRDRSAPSPPPPPVVIERMPRDPGFTMRDNTVTPYSSATVYRLPTLPPAAVPILAAPPVEIKLDLACGQSPRPGHEGIDIYSGAPNMWDLTVFPWRMGAQRSVDGRLINGREIQDNSVDALFCSHYIEHIPMEFVDAYGNPVRQGTPGAKDAFFAFFDEAYRVLKPGGWIEVIVPASSSDRAFQDPTHRRFLTDITWCYLDANVRKNWKLDHYNVDCHFVGAVVPAVSLDIGKYVDLKHEEAARRMMVHERNHVLDWHVKMQAVKPNPLARATA